MLRLLAWLESHGVRVDTADHRLATVGELLSMLEHAAFPGLSVRVSDGRDGDLAGPADVPAPAGVPADPLVPVLQGHAFRLAPVVPADMDFLYSLAVQPETCFRWRYRGAPPSTERFAEDLWRQVLVQFVARGIEDDRPVGHVVAYGADPGMRYVYLGAVFAPQYTGTGLAAHAVALFARYLFHNFPLHKVYLEVPGFNWPQVASGQGRLFQVEGVLRDHHFYAGRCWDEYVCAIYPDQPASAAA